MPGLARVLYRSFLSFRELSVSVMSVGCQNDSSMSRRYQYDVMMMEFALLFISKGHMVCCRGCEVGIRQRAGARVVREERQRLQPDMVRRVTLPQIVLSNCVSLMA